MIITSITSDDNYNYCPVSTLIPTQRWQYGWKDVQVQLLFQTPNTQSKWCQGVYWPILTWSVILKAPPLPQKSKAAFPLKGTTFLCRCSLISKPPIFVNITNTCEFLRHLQQGHSSQPTFWMCFHVYSCSYLCNSHLMRAGCVEQWWSKCCTPG